MKSLQRKEINPIKMSTNPPKAVVNSGYRVINTNGYIYEYVGIGWIQDRKAEQKDYLEIPQLMKELKKELI